MPTRRGSGYHAGPDVGVADAGLLRSYDDVAEKDQGGPKSRGRPIDGCHQGLLQTQEVIDDLHGFVEGDSNLREVSLHSLQPGQVSTRTEGPSLPG